MLLRVAGKEAAFPLRLTATASDHKMRVEPIEVMVFDDRGKVTAMKSPLVGGRRHQL